MKKISLLVFALSILLMLGTKSRADEGMKHGGDAGMKMHHLHMMMNHGLKMATEGSNLVMLSDMKMAPGVDEITHKHGHDMIAKGKETILNSLNGPEMMSMMKGEHAKSGAMQYTHELGNDMLKYVDMLEKMAKAGPMKPGHMAMHHQHMAINHALGMALDGSNMNMMGKMGMAGSVDDFSVGHGTVMTKDARSLLNSVMQDKTMIDMHKAGKSPEKDPMMMKTHNLSSTAMKIMDKLSKMSGM